MRLLIMGAALALSVTACEAADPYADLKADCDILVQDPDAEDNIADMGTDEAGFCACMVTLVAEADEADQALITTTLDRVTGEMAETGQGAEEIVGAIMKEARAAPDAEGNQTTMDGINRVGRLIDEVGDAFRDGGVCAV